MKSRVLLLPIVLLGLPGCFNPSDDAADEIGDSGTGDTGTSDTTSSGSTDTTSSTTDPTDTTDTTTGTCEGPGCPCVDSQECTDGLECVDNSCTEVVCGDGVAQGLEQCDDANTVEGDGCDNDCTYTEVISVHAGGAHTCVLIEGGRVKCWGWNASGQLGYGNTQNVGDDEVPADVDDVSLPGPATALVVGDEHSCALLSDMGVRCWGKGADGRLGYGNVENIGDDETPTMTVAVGAPVVQLDAGAFHNCARLDNSKLRCWGLGVFGRLGYGNLQSIGDNELPMAAGDVMIGGAITNVAVGGAHSCATLSTGDLRCWGRNEQGQLGYGNLANVGDDELPSAAGNVGVVPAELDPQTKIDGLALGVTHTCALFETGDVLCWGDNLFGQLGQGNTAQLGDNELPASASLIPLPSAATAISAGGGHTCALLADGDVYCWGGNSFGELGYGNVLSIGDNEAAATGGAVELGAAVVQLDLGFFHTCAVTSTNEVRCWGNNDAGQLGQGNTDRIGDDELPIDASAISLF